MPTLSREYLGIRNRQMATKALTAEMQLAERRGELIETDLVVKQAGFLFVSLRQKILSIPQTYARRLLGINDAKEMNAKLKEMSLSMLEELRHLPKRVTNPDWLKELEADDGK
jgi:hypothetical protein